MRWPSRPLLATAAVGASTPADPGAWSGARARAEARSILAEGRFHDTPGSSAPRPFRGPLRWLGERFDGPLRWVLDRLEGVLDRLEGIATWFVDRPALAAILVAGTAGVLVAVLVRGRARQVSTTGGLAPPGMARRAPEPIERAALEAERAGDHERAVRLWFHAGLLRLDRVGRIRFDPALTTGDVDRALESPSFRHLAWRFDEIVYGRRDASAGDVEATRTGWSTVLAESESRRGR